MKGDIGKILAGALDREQTWIDTENANSLTSKLLAGVINNPSRNPMDELNDEIARQHQEWLDSPEGKDFYK